MISTETRRAVLAAGGLSLAGVAGWSLGGQTLFYSALTPETSAAGLSVQDAFGLAQSGQIILVDIRRPDEWAATGSPVGSVQIDMRRNDLEAALQQLRTDQPDLPIAVICMRGVRSARLTNRLLEAGFTEILDVPEGMLGSAAGPGWVRRGLPVYGRG